MIGALLKHPAVRYLLAVLSVLLATFISLPLYPAAVDFPALILLAAVAISAKS